MLEFRVPYKYLKIFKSELNGSLILKIVPSCMTNRSHIFWDMKGNCGWFTICTTVPLK